MSDPRPWYRHRIPLGGPIVAVFCFYEVFALTFNRTTISDMAQKYPAVGVLLITALAQHWFLERPKPASARPFKRKP